MSHCHAYTGSQWGLEGNCQKASISGNATVKMVGPDQWLYDH